MKFKTTSLFFALTVLSLLSGCSKDDENRTLNGTYECTVKYFQSVDNPNWTNEKDGKDKKTWVPGEFFEERELTCIIKINQDGLWEITNTTPIIEDDSRIAILHDHSPYMHTIGMEKIVAETMKPEGENINTRIIFDSAHGTVVFNDKHTAFTCQQVVLDGEDPKYYRAIAGTLVKRQVK